MPIISRRECLAALTASAAAAERPAGVLVESHIHLFASDPKRFPYHRNAVYKPPAYPLADYVKFAREAKIDYCVIVHPEPYQDDHRYLEHCFANEPSPGFFKGTCLFDPIAPDTPSRMKELVSQNRGRIVALRIHENRERNTPATTSGAIRDRDLRHPAMKTTWRAAHDLGLAIQMHFIPWHAEQIFELAQEFRDTPVILDHLARAGQGSPAEFPLVLKLAKLPRVYMKYSGVGYSSKQGFPFADAKPIVKAAYDAFGPERMIWGGLGHNMKEFSQASEVLDAMFDYASENDRARIRGLNAKALFKFA